ncbi:hypothetical protein UFOVP413_8 [uncultured Caudovirales phage]|uniref:Uncharacterized protein n=1 Tax=uncultured Caudovirales phage TaxID=2100421 RepID=A0A6J5M6A9_9CAUD|nr:hypothetical protein UFOVP413_8 [uncultured Caudovirales phage]
MAVRETSLLAYADILADGRMNDRQQRVFDSIAALKIASDQDIARHLRWEINKVTPRRGELAYKLKIIEEAGFGRNAQNRPVQLWRIRPKQQCFDFEQGYPHAANPFDYSGGADGSAPSACHNLSRRGAHVHAQNSAGLSK